MEIGKIILIGAGNVAHHLAPALLQAGLDLCQIYSRSIESARRLGVRTGVAYTAEINDIYPDGDLYLFCVSDDNLPAVLKSVRVNRDALLLHTSGSQPMDVLKPYAENYGVLYPVQTFSRRRELSFREIPLCVEGNVPVVTEWIKAFAKTLSDSVYEIDSHKRKNLHLAAVFVNNFSNYLYNIGSKIMAGSDLPFDLLRPLIFETANKVMQMSPEDAQTGPARRGDESILGMHKALLKDNKEWLRLYTLLSEEIRALYAMKEKDGIQKAEAAGDVSNMPTLW